MVLTNILIGMYGLSSSHDVMMRSWMYSLLCMVGWPLKSQPTLTMLSSSVSYLLRRMKAFALTRSRWRIDLMSEYDLVVLMTCAMHAILWVERSNI